MEIAGKNAKKENMILTFVLWCILCGCSMVVMLFTAANKTIVITDTAQEQAAFSVHESQQAATLRNMLKMEETGTANELCIPLEDGIKAENVVMENHYTEQELWIYIKEAGSSFYDSNQISGDLTFVQEGWYEPQRDGLILKINLEGVWEYNSTMEGNSLHIAFYKPHDLYRQVIVVDPVGGGSENGITVEESKEKEIALRVAMLLPVKITEKEIKLYFTRTDDRQVSMEQRCLLAQAVDADCFLQIGASVNRENEDIYGIQSLYNEEYYIPEFGNVELADTVTKAVTVAASNRALGLFPAEEGSVLRQLNMPAAKICVGYLSNEQERSLLMQEAYQEKLAEGIAEAILEVYTKSNIVANHTEE